MFLSIVIPSFNAQQTIVSLLSSLGRCLNVDFMDCEIIVVDDASEDGTVAKVLDWTVKNTRIAVKVITLSENLGPAHARNVGVKYARGSIVLFLDADVVVYPSTIGELIDSFKRDPDLFALTGVWDKVQKSKSFFPNFKALRDWSYWINERDPRHYYYLFSTRVAAIDRALFLRLGGFNERYQGALVEDIELTYRIARRYAVVFNPKVIVRHEFEGFVAVAKKYFWRSFYWSRIYRERKKFDPVATTGKEALTTISAAAVVVFSFLTLLSYLSHLSNLRSMALIAGTAFLLIHLWGVRKFLHYVLIQRGIVFAIQSFFMGIILYVVIFSGACASFIHTRGKLMGSAGSLLCLIAFVLEF